MHMLRIHNILVQTQRNVWLVEVDKVQVSFVCVLNIIGLAGVSISPYAGWQ